jgi:molybdopterin/thiamine biosynthesis adenylyltransferase
VPPPPELAPSCAEAGVLGVLPGIIGLLQATEAIKILLGKGDALIGRLLRFDALRTDFQILRMGRDPACPSCGDGVTFSGFIDYDQFCSVSN